MNANKNTESQIVCLKKLFYTCLPFDYTRFTPGCSHAQISTLFLKLNSCDFLNIFTNCADTRQDKQITSISELLSSRVDANDRK